MVATAMLPRRILRCLRLPLHLLRLLPQLIDHLLSELDR